MPADRNTLEARLAELGIATTTVAHEAVFTVEESVALRDSIPGARTKNLFLIDPDGRMVLVVAKDDTRVDLKALAKRLGFGRFSFGKAARLEACGIGHAARPHQPVRRGRHRRGRSDDHDFRRGQLPSAGKHGDDEDGHGRSHPLHQGMRP
jgi:Aminoacyl-tRNA editing domain